MERSAAKRLLKAVDLVALAFWLALERTARLAAALAKPPLSALARALVSLGGRRPVEKALKSPLAREAAEILASPAAKELLKSLAGSASAAKEALDVSPGARRLLLAAVALLALRAVLQEESGPPAGSWRGLGVCVASYYDKGFLGKPTASGEVFSPYEYTAAHKSLPFGSYLKLRNLENGREVVVRVNDRGPFVPGRELDLSRAAAKALGMLESGLARVEARILKEKGA